MKKVYGLVIYLMLHSFGATAQCPFELSIPIGIFAPFKHEKINEVSDFTLDRIQPGIHTGVNIAYADGKNYGKWIYTLNLAYNLNEFTTYHSRDFVGSGFNREEAILQRYIHIASIGAGLRKQINKHNTKVLAWQTKLELFMPVREEFKLTLLSHRALSDEVTEQTEYVIHDYLKGVENYTNSTFLRFSPTLHYEHRVSAYFSWLLDIGPTLTFRTTKSTTGYDWLWGANVSIGAAICFPPRSGKPHHRPRQQTTEEAPITYSILF